MPHAACPVFEADFYIFLLPFTRSLYNLPVPFEETSHLVALPAKLAVYRELAGCWGLDLIRIEEKFRAPNKQKVHSSAL